MTEREIFTAALEKQSAAEREAFLQGACANDSALRQHIEGLLRERENLNSLLERPPAGLAVAPSPTVDRGQPEQPGTLIGRYKLLEQVGEGGMGVVYVAEQTEPVRRRVALKIIKPGMDTKQVIARFEAERQALAMMDHPNIARVLDAGTTGAGRPYFVMELVRGMPITEYCDKVKLSPRQRLELFVDVCQAVQHAHQKGIIHRDLKPSNVMVTTNDGRPVVKVIDFGVAKAVGQQLTERTVYTALTQLVGTPLYMSPEQAELTSNDVDTRSDVYSLGVLLYELLTGQTPFDKEALSRAGFDEMRRIIREDEPLRPSRRFSTLGVQAISTASQHRGVDERRLSRMLSGELDWIVMKALEKDRSRRYESASSLAADIQRYLSDEPVLACPPTTMYRFQKFSRKHKPALVTTIAIAACLILGTTVSAWQAARANANEQKAVANALTAQEKEQEAIKQRDEVKTLADKLAAKDKQLQRTLYAAHMNLAHNAFEAGAPARLRELLAQHRPQPGEADLRSFEWHYLNRLLPADLVLEHAGRVASVTYSPDGKLLATTSAGGLTVWDVQTGDKLFSQPAGLYATAAFSPDSKRVATPAKIWDAKTGQELLSLSTEAQPLAFGVAFTPDGKQLATGRLPTPTTPTSAHIAIWDAQTGEELRKLEGHGHQIRSLAFSPDGKRLASASGDKTVKLWDAQSGQVLHTLEGHTNSVFGVAYSPDGKRLASASQDQTVKLWDALSGNEIRTVPGQTSIGVAFSPDGKRLASGSQGNAVKVWDVESGDELFALKGHTRAVWSVAFSPDGKHLASASAGGTVLVREAKPVQKALVLGGGPGVVTQVAFSPDGKRLTTLGQGPKVWDTQTGEKLLAIDSRSDNPIGPRSNSALSLDGRRLASGGDSFPEGKQWTPNQANSANIWDLLTGEKLFTIRRVGSARVFTLSPDGNRLVVTNNLQIFSQRLREQPSQLFDVKTGQEIRSWKDPVGDMVFSPDGKLLAGYSGAKILKLWDAQTGDEVLTIAGAAGPRAFSRDGKRLATASDDETVVKLWNANTGQELLALKGHSGAVNHIAFSPDNKRLATTSNDETIKVWDTETAQELLTLAGHGGAAFSPDGNRLAAGGPNGTVLIYDATPLPEKP